MINTLTNKKLKNLIKLSSHVRVFIPSTINVNEITDNESFVTNIQKSFVEYFEGATIYNAVGSWLSVNTGVVNEKITIVESYTTTAGLDKNIDNVIADCEALKKDMKQETIALEINGELYFI